MAEDDRAPGPAPPLELVDSRRLTGPNLLWDRPGAVLDVALSPHADASLLERAVELWSAAARRILDAVGWRAEAACHRVFPRGASLAISAPVDALYAATEVDEQAWEATLDRLTGREPRASLERDAIRLRAVIAEESNPPLLELARAARGRGLLFLSDDEHASVGSGTGAATWRVREIPDPAAIDWTARHDVPIALVTGTNGKTTTVRLLAAMARAAGLTPGLCSTDGIRVGDATVETGDFSGPEGARTVLRHPAVEIAVLETARGGLLRRGLATPRADVAVVTNVAEDHLGELGVHDVAALAEVKLIPARVARRLVLNADDPVLAAAAARHGLEPVWFGLDAHSPLVARTLARGGSALRLEGDDLVRLHGDRDRVVLARASSMPLALGGAALHNVANALAACAAAGALGFPDEAVRRALAAFGADPGDNPGRLNRYQLGGVVVVLDFAHNPHGFEALLATARAHARGRLSVVLGQAGDRSDQSIRDLARTVARAAPDHCVIKSLPEYLRGRNEGEVERLIEEELVLQGMPPAAIERAIDELDSLERGLAWARSGDLVLQVTHSHRDEVIARLEALGAAPLP